MGAAAPDRAERSGFGSWGSGEGGGVAHRLRALVERCHVSVDGVGRVGRHPMGFLVDQDFEQAVTYLEVAAALCVVALQDLDLIDAWPCATRAARTVASSCASVCARAAGAVSSTRRNAMRTGRELMAGSGSVWTGSGDVRSMVQGRGRGGRGSIGRAAAAVRSSVSEPTGSREKAAEPRGGPAVVVLAGNAATVVATRFCSLSAVCRSTRCFHGLCWTATAPMLRASV